MLCVRYLGFSKSERRSTGRNDIDKYTCFKELKQCENDFVLDICDRRTSVTILAPHGGMIEPHTTEIARLIAGDTYNYFCFNGRKEGNNSDLHITSHRYDEEHAVALVKQSLIVVAVHGCTILEPTVFLGGLDSCLKDEIAAELTAADIAVDQPDSAHSGTHRNNICNRGVTGKGVQMECPRPLRDSPDDRVKIAAAVRLAISKST